MIARCSGSRFWGLLGVALLSLTTLATAWPAAGRG